LPAIAPSRHDQIKSMTHLRCFIYKSLRKADTYLYVVNADDFAAVPTALRERLGRLEFVLELELSPERKLARADGAQVIAALSSQGYYLQLPPVDAPADIAGS
jgi:uncharacterized protein YcgL (UPF0745 family)